MTDTHCHHVHGTDHPGRGHKKHGDHDHWKKGCDTTDTLVLNLTANDLQDRDRVLHEFGEGEWHLEGAVADYFEFGDNGALSLTDAATVAGINAQDLDITVYGVDGSVTEVDAIWSLGG